MWKFGSLLVGASALLVGACTPIKPPPPPGPTTLEITPPAQSFIDAPDRSGDSFDFGVQNTGTSRSGELELLIEDSSGDGTFAVETDGCTGIALDPDAFCLFDVRYTNDTGGGTATANLVVNGAPGESASAPLSGTGLAGGPAQLVIDPTSPSLTGTPDTPGDAVALTVTNVGGETSGSLSVSFGSQQGIGAFALVSNSCAGTTLDPGEGCTITVTYTNGTGAGTATVGVGAAANPGGSVNVTVTGTGLPGTSPAQLAISPTNAALSDTPGAPGETATFTVTNIGGATTGALNVFLCCGPVGSGEFVEETDTCTLTTLNPGQDCTVTVRYFNATGAGADSTAVRAFANPGGTVDANVTGMGLP